MAVSNRLRFEILRRDRFACRYCGARADDGAVLEIDHVLPKVLGGDDKATNLVAACVDCNGGKTSSHPDSPSIEDVEADSIRWWKAMRRAANKVLADREALAEARQQFEASWNCWTYADGDERKHLPKPDDWAESVEDLLSAGLPLWVLQECIREAMKAGRGCNSYFDHTLTLARRRFSELRNDALGTAATETLADESEVYDARAVVRDLLDYVNEEEREAEFVKVRKEWETADEDEVEALAAERLASRAFEDRWSLQTAVERLLRAYPADEQEAARREATATVTEFLGRATEVEILSHAATILTEYSEAMFALAALPEAERNAWISYVAAWPQMDADKRAIVIRAAETARRVGAGQGTVLQGMCQAPVEDSPIGRCLHSATHSFRIDDCLRCPERGLEDCSGGHLVCTVHRKALIENLIRRESTGEPIKARDFAELVSV